MSSIAGRGNNSETENDMGTQLDGADKTEPIGVKPDMATAEDVFLRDEQVLLKAKELSVECGLLYSYSDQMDIMSSSESESIGLDLGFRYGLTDNLQLFSTIPLAYHAETLTVFDEKERNSKRSIGNITVGLRRSIMQEGLWKPGILLSIDERIPTGDDSYGPGISMAFVKSLDPAVLFANIAFQYNIRNGKSDLLLSESKSTVSASLGYAYALNDTLTIGTSVSGAFPIGTMTDTILSQTRRQFILQLGLTSQIGNYLYRAPLKIRF